MDGPPSGQPPKENLAMCQTVTLHLLQAPAGPTSGTISGGRIIGRSCPSFDAGAVGKGRALCGVGGHSAWMAPFLRIRKQKWGRWGEQEWTG